VTKEQALAWAKGPKNLAEKLRMTTSAVCQWQSVPLVQQYRIAILSGGKLKVNDPLMPKEPLV